MSLFNYNFFPILFFLIWNILYVKPFFSKNSGYQSSLPYTLRLPKNSLHNNLITFQNQTNTDKNLLEILLQPEMTVNQFSDYSVKERPLFHEEKPGMTNTKKLPINIFLNHKLQSKSLTRKSLTSQRFLSRLPLSLKSRQTVFPLFQKFDDSTEVKNSSH